MLQDHFKINFIFLIYVITQINSAILLEHAAEEAVTLSDTELRSNCTSDYCTCADIPQWDGVDCEPVDWTSFPRLNFRHFKYLPNRMFLGLRLHEINLFFSDGTVAEKFLEGIFGLEKFTVHQSSIKAVPDFGYTKDSIKYVEIESSGLASLDGKHLQNLTSVFVLSFRNNSIRYIDPDVFSGTYNVQSLVLSHNKLTSIPPKLLYPMRKLETFSADHNNLLHVNNLFSVTRPLMIELAFNNITNFSLIEIFNVEKYEPFSGFDIWTLDMSYNFIEETSTFLSTCSYSQDFMIKIRTLYLNGNELLSLNDCLKCSQLKRLEIIGTSIQYLTEKDFLSVLITGELLLRENQICKIDTCTFKHLNTSLQELDLSSNEITSINGSVKYLSSLRILNLSHNSIQTFAEDEFTGLHSLIKLYIQHNQIKSLAMTLQNLERLKALNITHNDIELLKPDQVPKNLRYIYIEGNALKCDCKLLPFISKMKDDEKKGGCLKSELVNNLRNHLKCPDTCSCQCTEYGGVYSMFVDCSSRNLSRVPHFAGNKLEQLEVDELFSSDDQFYHIMYQNIDPSLHLEDKVLGVSLENNSLDVLHAAQLPPNLVQLYLSDNKLRRFPEHLMDYQLNLKKVTLSGNPWNCDCEALKFKKWLTFNNHIVKDFDNIRCGMSVNGETNLNGSVIWKLNDADLCPTTDFVWIVLICSLSFVTFCLFAKVFYSRYELNIKVTLYSHGFTFVKEEVTDHDKAFDAFISFSHKDDEFVISEIISEIENRDPNIRLCLHYRHFRPGVPIIDNITHAVQKSKRTVLILSSSFLESEWCVLEFQTAYVQTLQDKVHRIIAVKVGELPARIDPTIQVYLDSTTYLTWDDSNFWNKLMYVLPCRTSDTSPVLRFVGDNENVFHFPSSDL